MGHQRVVRVCGRALHAQHGRGCGYRDIAFAPLPRTKHMSSFQRSASGASEKRFGLNCLCVCGNAAHSAQASDERGRAPLRAAVRHAVCAANLEAPFVIHDLVKVLRSLGMTDIPRDGAALWKDLDQKVASANNHACAPAARHQLQIVAAPRPAGKPTGMLVRSSSAEAMIVASLEGLGAEELKHTVVQLQQNLVQSRKTATAWRVAAWRADRKVAELKTQLAEKTTALERHNYVKAGKKRPDGAEPRKYFRLTVPGMYKLALKRNMGYAGSVTAARMLEVPIGRLEVNRCENLLRANLWGRHANWYATAYERLDEFIEDLIRQTIPEEARCQITLACPLLQLTLPGSLGKLFKRCFFRLHACAKAKQRQGRR